MALLKDKKQIINIDETWLSQTNFSRRKWSSSAPKQSVANIEITPRIAMITALDTEGRIYFSLSHANTNSQMMLLFLSRLCRVLDKDGWGWRDNTVILLDGAKYHTSKEAKDALAYLQIPAIFSGPYSYDGAPCELLFGHLKKTDINASRLSTGKK